MATTLHVTDKEMNTMLVNYFGKRQVWENTFRQNWPWQASCPYNWNVIEIPTIMPRSKFEKLYYYNVQNLAILMIDRIGNKLGLTGLMGQRQNWTKTDLRLPICLHVYPKGRNHTNRTMVSLFIIIVKADKWIVNKWGNHYNSDLPRTC